jgi:fused signal recognition particle receptor
MNKQTNTGFFGRLRAHLNKGDSWLTRDISELVSGKPLDEDTLEDIETRLLMADVGVDATQKIIAGLEKSAARHPEGAMGALRDALLQVLQPAEQALNIDASKAPFVLLVTGVNGAGKTTTIGKLAGQFKDQGLSVMLAAGDTFRAAAVEQLQAWGERNDVPVIVPGSSGNTASADPAAVAHDAIHAAKSRQVDVLIIDTAGRLHTQRGLMDELQKVRRVIEKLHPGAPHETLLVVDGTTGQNALNQAREFNAAVTLTGLAVTKLDGSAKGGVMLALAEQTGLPIRYIGIGEAIDDLASFNAAEFVNALLGTD